MSIPMHVEVFNQLGEIGSQLWTSALQLHGLNSDPKMVSVTLYRRLWSHFRGFRLLWQEKLSLEADILLRSAVETAICLAALRVKGPWFVDLLRSDAAYTMQSQVALLRAAGEIELAREGEQQFRQIFGERRADGKKHRPLDWRELAIAGEIPELYDEYRNLSGVAGHVTGVSVIFDVVDAEKPDKDIWQRQQAEFQEIRLDRMIRVMAQGYRDHAVNVGDEIMVDIVQMTMRRIDAMEHAAPE